MDELIGQPASRAGNDDVVAEKTIGFMLGFLRSEGPSDIVQPPIDSGPGRKLRFAAASTGGGLSELMSNGLRAVATTQMAHGQGIGEIQSSAGELFKFSRDTIGAEQMGEIIAATPKLNQFA